MWSALDAMATTSFVAVREMENGLSGREIVVGGLDRLERWWICNVESQEAEMRIFLVRL